MQRHPALTATLKVNSKQTDTAMLDVFVLEMAELILEKHRKIAKADRATFLQARLPHFKRKNHNAYNTLAKTLARQKTRAPQPTPLELESLNVLAQELAKDVEANTQRHWTLTLLHRHYLKAIRLDQKAIQTCINLMADNESIQAALNTQHTYLETLNQLLQQLETTLVALSQFTTNEDQFAKTPEILTNLLEKSFIGDEANMQNNIKRFIFRALTPEVINLDTITLSETQAEQLDELANLVLAISKNQAAAQNTRAALTQDQTNALTQLGITLQTPMHYITHGVLEPMKQAASNITHTTRASQAAYRAIQRRRNVVDLMTNLTTVLDETNQLHGNLTTAQLLLDNTTENETKAGVLSYVANTVGQAVYQGANAVIALGMRVASAVPMMLPSNNAPTNTLLENQEDDTTLAMAAFAKITCTLGLNDNERKAACLKAFNHKSQTNFTLTQYEQQVEHLKTPEVALALELRDIRNLILNTPDEAAINSAISAIIAIKQAIESMLNKNHQAALKKHLNDVLFTLHECLLLPALYDMLDNKTGAGIADITLQKMISHIESRHSTPSPDDWKALKKHKGVSSLSIFKHRKQLPKDTLHPEESISMLDISRVRTPAQQTETQLKAIIDASLPTLFDAIIAAINTEKEAAQRLSRLLKGNKENAAYRAKLKKKIELCTQLLLALDTIKASDTSNIAQSLSHTLHGYTLAKTNEHLQNEFSSSFSLAKRLLRTANQISEMNGILATNNPLLSKSLSIIFSQCDLRNAALALDVFHSDNTPLNKEDTLWFDDALQNPLSTTTLPASVVANTLTQSTSGIVNLLKASASEAPGIIASRLLKLIPDLFPGMNIASLAVRQLLKSGIVSGAIERMITENSDPEVVANRIVSYFITSYKTEASIKTPEALTTRVLLDIDKSDMAEAHFTAFFFKFHRLCLLTNTEPHTMLASLDSKGEITDEAKLKCVALHHALYGAIQNNTMREGLQQLILKDHPYALILLLYRAKQQMNFALKKEAENSPLAETQVLIEEAYLSFEFLQTQALKLRAEQNAMIAASLNTLTEKLTGQATTLLKDTALLKQDSTLQLQKSRIASKTLTAEANAAKQNIPHVLLRIGKFIYNLFSIASFWYSSAFAPLLLPTTTAGGYFAHLIGFATAGASLLSTVLGALSVGVLIICFAARLAYELLYNNKDNFTKVWNNKTDSVPMKILKTAGYVGLAFANALFKTILTTFAVETIKTLAKSAWNKITILLFRKNMLNEIDELNKALGQLHNISSLDMDAREAQLDLLHRKMIALKNDLANSKHQASALQPLKEKVEQLEKRMEKLRATLTLISPQSATKIYQALNINPAAQHADENQEIITLETVAEAKTQGRIHAYGEDLAAPAAPATIHEPSRSLRLTN